VTKKARVLTSVLSALLVSAAVAGCDFLGLAGPSGPGELHANIFSPDGTEDGAAVLEIVGLAGVNYIGCENGDVYVERNGDVARVVVVLEDPGPISFQLRVTDVAEQPTVNIVQVADGNNELRSSLSDFEVEWVQLADSDRNFHRRGQ
jgi:hypothetical protein